MKIWLYKVGGMAAYGVISFEVMSWYSTGSWWIYVMYWVGKQHRHGYDNVAPAAIQAILFPASKFPCYL